MKPLSLSRLRRRHEIHHRDDAFEFLAAVNDKQFVRAAADESFHHFARSKELDGISAIGATSL